MPVPHAQSPARGYLAAIFMYGGLHCTETVQKGSYSPCQVVSIWRLPGFVVALTRKQSTRCVGRSVLKSRDTRGPQLCTTEDTRRPMMNSSLPASCSPRAGRASLGTHSACSWSHGGGRKGFGSGAIDRHVGVAAVQFAPEPRLRVPCPSTRQPAGDRTADGRDMPWAIEKGWVMMMAASVMNAHLGI